MAVTLTPRLGIKQWGADSDPPLTRAGMNADFAALEAVCAMFGVSTLAGLASTDVGRILRASDTGTFFWDTGSAIVGLSQTFAFYGNGADGTVTLAVDTTLSRDMNYDTLHVPAGITLHTAGFKLRCRTVLDVPAGGVVDNSGAPGSGATAGAAVATGTLGGGGAASAGQVNGSSGSPGVALGAYPLGGAGGNGGNGNGGGTTGGTPAALGVIPAASGGPVPTGVFNILMGAAIAYSVTPGTGAATSGLFTGGQGGSGGAGDTTNAGGGGGSGGGVIGVYARQITGTGTIAANGGAGAQGVLGNAGGGGGGGGGVILLVTNNLTVPVTLSVAGGALGPKHLGGTGSDGTAGGAGRVLSLIGV